MNPLSSISPRRSFNAHRGRVEDEHAIIFGMTRFGKTYLTEQLTRMRKYVVIHDPKAEYVLRGYKVCATIDEVLRATDSDHKAQANSKIIYQPSGREVRDDEAQSKFFRWLYDRQNTMCVLDEITSLAEGRREMPDSMLDCYSRGNARGISIIGLTQEPVYVPNVCMTQARHRYCFFVALEPHQKKVMSVMPGVTPERIEALPKYHFYYYQQGDKTATGPYKVRGQEITPRPI